MCSFVFFFVFGILAIFATFLAKVRFLLFRFFFSYFILYLTCDSCCISDGDLLVFWLFFSFGIG